MGSICPNRLFKKSEKPAGHICPSSTERVKRAQVLLATLNLLDAEDSGGSDAKDQENASD